MVAMGQIQPTLCTQQTCNFHSSGRLQALRDWGFLFSCPYNTHHNRPYLPTSL